MLDAFFEENLLKKLHQEFKVFEICDNIFWPECSFDVGLRLISVLARHIYGDSTRSRK